MLGLANLLLAMHFGLGFEFWNRQSPRVRFFPLLTLIGVGMDKVAVPQIHHVLFFHGISPVSSLGIEFETILPNHAADL